VESGAAVREQLLANPAIAATRAARAGRIIIIDNRLFMAVSHHIAGAVEALIEGLYGATPAESR
jgi:ABC-type hemin transport system substrate-binding protein